MLPRRWSQSAKVFWRAQVEPPQIPPHLTARLREVFDADLSQLGSWLGISLDCETFDAITRDRPHCWSARDCDVRA